MLNSNKIYLLDVLEGLKQVEDNSCQIIIVDPPYNIGKDFGNNGDDMELNEYFKWCSEWLKECRRVLMPNGTMFIYGFSEILAHIFVNLDMHKRWLVWYYTNKNIPSNRFWQRSHESIICCWKGTRIFNQDDVREPYTLGFLNGAAGKTRASTIGRLSNGKETIYKAHSKGALPRDVLKISTLAGGAGMAERWFFCKTCGDVYEPTELKIHQQKKHDIMKHPTQKPLAVCNRLILSAMQGRGIVLVPFAGSGSECVAAKKLGLDYVGFEINPDYIKLAEERIARS